MGVETYNAALKRPAFQSSYWQNQKFRARLVNDGFRGTNWHGRKPRKGRVCSASKYEMKPPWWAVDLGKPKRVYSVVLTNRGDCCGTWFTSLIATISPQSRCVLCRWVSRQNIGYNAALMKPAFSVWIVWGGGWGLNPLVISSPLECCPINPQEVRSKPLTPQSCPLYNALHTAHHIQQKTKVTVSNRLLAVERELVPVISHTTGDTFFVRYYDCCQYVLQKKRRTQNYIPQWSVCKPDWLL